MLLLAFAGLWRSTFLATILMPIGLTCALLASTEIPIDVALIRSAGGVVMCVYLFGNIWSVTLGRRRSFSLEYSFQAALALAVEVRYSPLHRLAPPSPPTRPCLLRGTLSAWRSGYCSRRPPPPRWVGADRLLRIHVLSQNIAASN